MNTKCRDVSEIKNGQIYIDKKIKILAVLKSIYDVEIFASANILLISFMASRWVTPGVRQTL